MSKWSVRAPDEVRSSANGKIRKESFESVFVSGQYLALHDSIDIVDCNNQTIGLKPNGCWLLKSFNSIVQAESGKA